MHLKQQMLIMIFFLMYYFYYSYLFQYLHNSLLYIELHYFQVPI
jgi:hypothetical protein